ncbi:LOW QUALITY PROTEIN: hypothetical protein U9M48_001950 [Paspalum notatum var. saurae]|uniref:Uncharacterized protein n=1 Tax=Paspalum notatum var. saurae TaxID=547442 RepID=A0AAQ3PPT4_PASNO
MGAAIMVEPSPIWVWPRPIPSATDPSRRRATCSLLRCSSATDLHLRLPAPPCGRVRHRRPPASSVCI